MCPAAQVSMHGTLFFDTLSAPCVFPGLLSRANLLILCLFVRPPLDLGQSSRYSSLTAVTQPDILSCWMPAGVWVFSRSSSCLQQRGHPTNMPGIVRTPESSLKITQVFPLIIKPQAWDFSVQWVPTFLRFTKALSRKHDETAWPSGVRLLLSFPACS